MTIAEATNIADSALEHTVRTILASLQAPEILKSTAGEFPVIMITLYSACLNLRRMPKTHDLSKLHHQSCHFEGGICWACASGEVVGGPLGWTSQIPLGVGRAHVHPVQIDSSCQHTYLSRSFLEGLLVCWPSAGPLDMKPASNSQPSYNHCLIITVLCDVYIITTLRHLNQTINLLHAIYLLSSSCWYAMHHARLYRSLHHIPELLQLS